MYVASTRAHGRGETPVSPQCLHTNKGLRAHGRGETPISPKCLHTNKGLRIVLGGIDLNIQTPNPTRTKAQPSPSNPARARMPSHMHRLLEPAHPPPPPTCLWPQRPHTTPQAAPGRQAKLGVRRPGTQTPQQRGTNTRRATPPPRRIRRRDQPRPSPTPAATPSGSGQCSRWQQD